MTTALRMRAGLVARKTSVALIAFAIVNVAIIPLLLGCDGPNPAVASASASTTVSRVAPGAEAAIDIYLPRRHTIAPNAVEGNVMTYERD